LKKPLSRYDSATVGRIAMKFGTVTHFDPLSLSMVKISNLKEIKMADGSRVKTLKSPCLGNGSIDLHETWHDDAF